MSEAVFIDDDGRVKLRIYFDGGTPPLDSITKAVAGAAFLDTDGKVKVRVYADGSNTTPATGNAQPGDVLAPKTFSNASGAQTGTMVDHTGQSPVHVDYEAGIPEEIRIAVPEGFYKANNPDYPIFVLEPNLTEDNIPVNVTMFGIPGAYTSDADATADDIRQGKIAYINGVKVTGTAVF
jgi:hypothetical protein